MTETILRRKRACPTEIDELAQRTVAWFPISLAAEVALRKGKFLPFGVDAVRGWTDHPYSDMYEVAKVEVDYDRDSGGDEDQ